MDETALAHLLRTNGGVLVRRHHPELATTMDWLLRTDRLVRVLPGVYAPPVLAALPLTRIRAACAGDPDAVLTGAAAARVSYWPAAPLDVVEVAVPRRRQPQPSFVFAHPTRARRGGRRPALDEPGPDCARPGHDGRRRCH